MGAKDVKELINLSQQELDDKLAKLKQELLEFRFQGAAGRLQKPSQIQKARKNIARILTIKRQAIGKINSEPIKGN